MGAREATRELDRVTAEHDRIPDREKVGEMTDDEAVPEKVAVGAEPRGEGR